MAHKSLKAANGEIFDLKKRIGELEEQLRNQAALHKRIAELDAENAKQRDHIIEQEQTIAGMARHIALLEGKQVGN